MYYKDDKNKSQNIFKKLNKQTFKKKSLYTLAQGIISLKNNKYDVALKKFENVLSKENTNIIY